MATDPDNEAPTAIFKVITEAEFPGGVRCMDCKVAMEESMPYSEHLEGFTASGIPMTHVACVYCVTCTDEDREDEAQGYRYA